GKTLLLATVVAVGATAIIVAADDHDSPPVAAPPSSGSSGGSGDGCFMCSCPLLYSYDGDDWVLDSGTYGGAFLKPFAYTDYDILESLRNQHDLLRMRLRAGDKETDHIDELGIIAIDHDLSTTIATDMDGIVHSVGATTPPLAARDSRGRDALPSVLSADGRSWESLLAVRDTASAEDLRESLTLEFPRPPGAAAARLVLRANKTAWAGHLMRAFVAAHGTATQSWYAAMDADSARALGFRRALEQEIHLSVSVWEGERWVRQSSVWGGGPEVQKTHAIPLDLSRVRGDRIRIRLESSPSFWLVDWVALDTTPERPVTLREVTMRSAIAPDGRDVTPELLQKDGRDLLLETGEVVELTLDAPPTPPGSARTYLSRTTGWYRYHAPETGPADTALLDYLLREPHGISKMSIAWMNAALTSLAVAQAR
ncbi:MAG TPA: hypothetical protein VFT97_00020, partial [Candidatus Eisenbacteria bacterium]|nr:hypothetical protein [Candidatus Eisenbacteria bacterium]